MARPSRRAELEATAALAGVRPETVRDFFFRSGKLSAETREAVAEAVLQTGYRPGTSTRAHRGPLTGVRVGYQLPRTTIGATRSPVMDKQLPLLVEQVQLAGGLLLPFVVELPSGPDESELDDLPTYQSRYAAKLSIEAMAQMTKRHRVTAFIVNDPRVDDPRMDLAAQGINVVSLAPALVTKGKATQERHDVSWVANDYRAGFGALVDDLRSIDRSRIGHLGFAEDGTIIPIVRRQAVLGHLADAPHLAVAFAESRGDVRLPEVKRWIDDNDLDAVVCDSDDLARLAQDAGAELGYDVASPSSGTRSLAVTGVDNAPVRAHRGGPRRWPTIEIDDLAYVGAIIETLARPDHSVPRQRLIAPLVLDPYATRDGATGA